ncbi:MAG: acetate--CoA ligase family protein [Candidatus Promineifilaceae bacterium]
MHEQRTMLSYGETEALLRRYDIALPASHLAQTPAEAAAAAELLGFPVALKAISGDISHKSDRGLVRLGLDRPAAVAEAAQALLEKVDWGTEATLEGLLVQRLLPGGVEMIAGIHHDAQFGPLVLLGSGGVLVELLDDAVLRLPPLTRSEALSMIEATRSYPLLQGFRGFPPADIDALAALLVNLSRLALAAGSTQLSLDLNPVLVLPRGQGVGVVDFRAEVSREKSI